MSAMGQVEAFRYVMSVGDMGGGGGDKTVIFIPSRELFLSERGVRRMKTGLASKAASDAIGAYVERVRRNECVYSQQELNQIVQQADSEARETIMLPAEDVEKIEELLREKTACEDRMKELNVAITAISKQLSQW